MSAWVLSEMFIMRMLNAKRQIAAIRAKVVVANPIKVSEIASEIKPNVIGMRLSNLATNQPEIGNPTNELMGMQSKSVPNSASLNPNVVLMVGIREAHVEKQMPERKKKTLKKNRCLFFFMNIQ